MKVTHKMFLVAYLNEYAENGIATALWNHCPTEGSDATLLREIEIDIEEPPVADQKKMLAGELEALRAYRKSVATAADVELQGKINSLLAIEHAE